MAILKTPAPLFRDPFFDGSSDPVVIYNHLEKEWWMFYTSRRANTAVVGVSNCFGVGLSIASSHDNGKTWVHRGKACGLEIDRGDNTFWAPEIFFDEKTETYHMIVGYVRGVARRWDHQSIGKNGMIHYTSKNLWDWTYENFVFDNCHIDLIDACVFEKPEGGYRMWYRDATQDWSVMYTDTEDFKTYSEAKLCVPDHSEGPNVFKFHGYYWLITDRLGNRDGLALYRADDLENWTYQKQLLKEPGTRPLDDTVGRHADVVVCGDRAYIFYFTQPYRDYTKSPNFEALSTKESICVIQVAEIHYKDGELYIDRDEDIDVNLSL